MSHDAAPHALSDAQVKIPQGHALFRLPWIAAGVGVVGLVASFALRGGDPKQFAF